MKTAKQARVRIPLGMLENKEIVFCAPPSMFPDPPHGAEQAVLNEPHSADSGGAAHSMLDWLPYDLTELVSPEEALELYGTTAGEK